MGEAKEERDGCTGKAFKGPNFVTKHTRDSARSVHFVRPMTDVAVGFSTATKQRLNGAPDGNDRRLLHASALALGSVLIDVKRNYSGLRTASRPHLAWLLAQRVLGATADSRRRNSYPALRCVACTSARRYQL